MTIELDHVIVSARNQVVSAKRLADLLGVRWAESGAGPFSPVYVNDGLTLDFVNDDGRFPIQHFCFRVDEKEFDAILQRIKAAGIKYRSTVRGPEDMQVNTQYGGRMVYWNEPDGHQWEMLTVSYARPTTDVTLSLILASALLTLAANLDLLDPQLKAKVMNSPLGRNQPWILD